MAIPHALGENIGFYKNEYREINAFNISFLGNKKAT
jgi:hypothetical protein